uniref:Uncharacterized protein n=1 Tax=Knipowitschia caucasica TaxID=637954 RepID=A0AAV2M666_KNICA
MGSVLLNSNGHAQPSARGHLEERIGGVLDFYLLLGPEPPASVVQQYLEAASQASVQALGSIRCRWLGHSYCHLGVCQGHEELRHTQLVPQ